MLKLVIILAAAAVCYGRTPATFYVYTQRNPVSPQVLSCYAAVTTPETTSEVTPETTSEVTPETTSEVTPETTSEVTPETTSEVTPETTSEVTPETTSEATPETTMSSGEQEPGLEARFNREDNTIILVHGHGGSLETRFNNLITREILLHQSAHNVIVVDWGDEASSSYSIASSRVPLVAADLADCITGLQERSAVNVSNLHLVGFGLGAHVVGIAARTLIRPVGYVGRITGLDPSGSEWGSNSLRLRSTDARYVEVIHTDDTGPLANGIGTAIGEVNFYANGGSNQPGCWSHSCSHERAYELFAASMFNTNLVGYPCRSKTQLNLNTCRGDPLLIGGTRLRKPSFNHLYRINTRRNYPF